MVNTKHDTSSYESRGYQREIFDGNVLYEAKNKAMKGSDWKPQVQRFEMTYLLELSKMQRDLENMEYEFLPTTNFTLHERGKLRRITGEQVQDRIVKHALCDEVLNPQLTEKDFTDFYRSWFKNHYKLMSKQQRANMDSLFNQLKEVTICTQSHSQTESS